MSHGHIQGSGSKRAKHSNFDISPALNTRESVVVGRLHPQPNHIGLSHFLQPEVSLELNPIFVIVDIKIHPIRLFWVLDDIGGVLTQSDQRLQCCDIE